MAKRISTKVSVTINPACMAIIDGARRLWSPEYDDNLSGLICKLIIEWSRIRDESGGGKTTTILNRIDQHEEADQQRHEELVKMFSLQAAIDAGCDEADDPANAEPV